MADPATYRPRPADIPTDPGVYRFLDEHGRVIYVGKAASLRPRLSSYFQDVAALHPRTARMVTTAAAVEWTVVRTEVEALALEYSWIKEFDPRFNVKYRDDKSYPYLAVTLGEEVPRVMVVRGAKARGTRYFGPYAHAWAIRDTVDQLLRVFPVRTCSAGVYRRAAAQGRPCLKGYIDRCAAPCVGRISIEDHRSLAEDLCLFLEGSTGAFVGRVEREMKAAAAELDFERAARLRDDLAALRKVVESNAVVLRDSADADVFALEADELEAAVQVFHVRGGRIRGQRGWVVERVEDLDEGQLVGRLLQQVYGEAEERVADAAGAGDVARPARMVATHAGTAPRADDAEAASRSRGSGRAGGTGPGRPAGGRRAGATSVDDVAHLSATAVPPEVLVPALPPDVDAVEQWLAGIRGARVSVRVPRRGDKKTLAGTAALNAKQALALHKTRRAGDLTQRSRALAELQEYLDLPAAPLRVECFDVSHTQGTHQVASMVVFEDGAPRKSDYRHFVVRGPDGEGARDDTAAMDEVLRRRFRRLVAERAARADSAAGPIPDAGSGAVPGADPGAALAAGEVDEDGVPLVSGPVDPTTGRPRRFAYPPDLLVVDGGAPQVAAAQRVLDDLAIDDVTVVGLAKRLEEVWLPDDDLPVILPRTSAGLYLLQHLRDESHRFAITHHRKRRSKGMTRSVLDGVPGLGPARQGALLRRFGSVARMRAASVEELAEVPGVGPATARAILGALAPRTADPADPAVEPA